MPQPTDVFPFTDNCSIAGEEDPGASLDTALIWTPAACDLPAAVATGMALAVVVEPDPRTSSERDDP